MKTYNWDMPVYTREMANIAMCALMSDVHACVDLGKEDEDNVYECNCPVSMHENDGNVSKAIVEFIENAVSKAINEAQTEKWGDAGA